MGTESLLLFGNVSQAPYGNNLLPAVRAFRRAFRTTLVEPLRRPGFVGTGGARPALVPDAAVLENADPSPDAAVCLGGALHFSPRARQALPAETALAGFALSDPYGLSASLSIAPEFDLFYTQDPQTLSDYAAAGVRARRCDPATDPELYRPLRADADCDVLYYGKWTAHRDRLLAALARRFRVRVHAYAGETRWSVPTLPPLETPEALCGALNRARLALETARLDDAPGKYADALHVTPRVFFAASCGVPSLIEPFAALSEYFEPGVEIATFASEGGLVETAGALLGDETARSAMGRRARERALRDHTWDRRVEAFARDVREWREQGVERERR